MKNAIDLHIGQRLRNRRWLQNMTQLELGRAIGIRFQQIQKYEKGDNRISASRIWDLARALEVPVSYFYEGLEGSIQPCPDDAMFEQKETANLVRAYYAMGERPRRTFLELALAVGNEAAQGDVAAIAASLSSAKVAA